MAFFVSSVWVHVSSPLSHILRQSAMLGLVRFATILFFFLSFIVLFSHSKWMETVVIQCNLLINTNATSCCTWRTPNSTHFTLVAPFRTKFKVWIIFPFNYSHTTQFLSVAKPDWFEPQLAHINSNIIFEKSVWHLHRFPVFLPRTRVRLHSIFHMQNGVGERKMKIPPFVWFLFWRSISTSSLHCMHI